MFLKLIFLKKKILWKKFVFRNTCFSVFLADLHSYIHIDEKGENRDENS